MSCKQCKVIAVLVRLVNYYSYMAGVSGVESDKDKCKCIPVVKNKEEWEIYLQYNKANSNDNVMLHMDEGGVHMTINNNHIMYNGNEVFRHIYVEDKAVLDVFNHFEETVNEVEEEFEAFVIK